MLDCARTCHSVETIEQLLRLLNRYGFNRFHWHLTDDQGWRFHVPGYPLLTSQSSQYQRGNFSHYDCAWADTVERAEEEAPRRWRGGAYSDEEIARVVSLANDLNIEIIPEVDLPGHMAAAIRAYPELGRPEGLPLPPGSMRENMYWAAANDLLWPGEATLEFLHAAVGRVLELFPGRYIHLGGDECAYLQWESDPQLMRWCREQGIDGSGGLHAWFMERGIELVRDCGRTPIIWDDAAKRVDGDVIVMAWGQGQGISEATKGSHRYVIADACTLYLNRIDPEGPPTQKGMVPAISVEDILTDAWWAVDSNACLGIQVCLWCEYVLDHDDLMEMVFPRLLAVAARLWSTGTDLEFIRELVAREYRAILPHTKGHVEERLG